jgi:hypothetical protein
MCIYTGVFSIFTPFTFAFAPQTLGDDSVFTLFICWSVVNVSLGAICNVSGDALMMDCLPSVRRRCCMLMVPHDEVAENATRTQGRDGRPSDPARDWGLMGYADRISGLILPPVMGQIIKLWPTHAQAYKSFFLIGGSLTAVSFLIFALAVHPLDEPLGLRLQCTRHLFHRRYDEEVVDFGRMEARRRRCDAIERGVPTLRGSRPLLGARSPPWGARLCDALVFDTLAVRRRASSP